METTPGQKDSVEHMESIIQFTQNLRQTLRITYSAHVDKAMTERQGRPHVINYPSLRDTSTH